MNINDDKVREMLNEEKIPQELEPENIKLMLDAKAPAKKRKNIKMAGRITAGVAAAAVLCGSAVYYAGNNGLSKRHDDAVSSEAAKPTDATKPQTTTAPKENGELTLEEQKSYMAGASDYSEVYQLYKERAQKLRSTGRYFSGVENGADEVEAVAEENEDYTADSEGVKTDTPKTTGTNSTSSDDYSKTHDQEDGVLEADIAKTDGKNIYYIYNDYDTDGDYNCHAYMNCAAVENGKFTHSEKMNIDIPTENIFDADYEIESTMVTDMYIYNGSLAVIGTVDAYKKIEKNNTFSDPENMPDSFSSTSPYWYNYKCVTYVSLYTTGDHPELITTYFQDGGYNDVRISPDGYMYLVTNYTAQDYENIKEEDLEYYVPSCGVDKDVDLLPASDILMPAGEAGEEKSFNYTIIGSLDMNNEGCMTKKDAKALAGYTGQIYSSADNIYTTYGWEDTDITRISVSEGEITPAASGTIEGRVRDQFAMSEYNGYFRVAATSEKYVKTFHKFEDETVYYERAFEDSVVTAEGNAPEERGYYTYELEKKDNRMYVLDMDMNLVGSLTDFGLDEEVKSVRYDGDIAYVVTFRQTDPLFAIDLSDPTSPKILSEFKIPGFSTYMEKWEDGMLFGFGSAAGDTGGVNGIKFTMFDNSDPNDLKEIDTYEILDDETHYHYSDATWNRKALLIAPEKNLIGIPVRSETYSFVEDEYTTYVDNRNMKDCYEFFKFEDGKFVKIGELGADSSTYSLYNDSRAVYIGDYVYTLHDYYFESADISTITHFDQVNF